MIFTGCDYNAEKNNERESYGTMAPHAISFLLKTMTANNIVKRMYPSPYKVAINIKVGSMGEKVMSRDDIAALAALPSREELMAKLLGTMQAPIAKFVQTLNEVPARFVRGLAAVRDNK